MWGEKERKLEASCCQVVYKSNEWMDRRVRMDIYSVMHFYVFPNQLSLLFWHVSQQLWKRLGLLLYQVHEQMWFCPVFRDLHFSVPTYLQKPKFSIRLSFFTKKNAALAGEFPAYGWNSLEIAHFRWFWKLVAREKLQRIPTNAHFSLEGL